MFATTCAINTRRNLALDGWRTTSSGTWTGEDLIVASFQKHSGQIKKVFSELGPEELRSLETALKKVGKRAAMLMDKRSPAGTCSRHFWNKFLTLHEVIAP